MKKYVEPIYEIDSIETEDIMSASIQDGGQGTVGNISGDKGIFNTDFGGIM